MGAMEAAVEVMRWQGRGGNTAAVEVRSLWIFVFLHTFMLLRYVTYVFIIFRMEHKICKINICLNDFMFLGMLQYHILTVTNHKSQIYICESQTQMSFGYAPFSGI